MNRAWQRRLTRRRLYVNDLYLTILRRPMPGLGGLADLVMGLFTSRDLKRQEEDRADSIRALQDATANIISTLSHYRPRLLTCYEQDGRLYSEPLEFLSYLLNHERRPVLPTDRPDRRLPAHQAAALCTGSLRAAGCGAGGSNIRGLPLGQGICGHHLGRPAR